MAAVVFDEIMQAAQQAGITDLNTAKAAKWMQQKASQTTSLSDTNLNRDKNNPIYNPLMGNMYFFHYDPKHKKTLPYYDRFPLILPYHIVHGGFYGLNLHYIPPRDRTILLNELLNNLVSQQTNKLILNYQILNSASRYRYFKPCVKHYLNNHVKSQFIRIAEQDWKIALWLPSAKWTGAPQDQIWNQSKKSYN